MPDANWKNAVVNDLNPYHSARYENTGHMARVPVLVAYWNIARQRKWLILAAVVFSIVIGVVLTFLATPYFTATARLQIDREGEQVTNVEEVTRIEAAGEREFYDTQYALLRSRSLAERVARSLNLTRDEQFLEAFEVPEAAGTDLNARESSLRRATQILLEHVAVAPIRNSSLVDISFESPDPAMSAAVANAWAEQYIETNIDRRFESTLQARDFLEDRLAGLREQLETAERNLVNYAANRGIISFAQRSADGSTSPTDRTLTTINLEELSGALAEATQARIAAESALSARRSGEQESPTLNSLRERRAAVSVELAELRATFSDSYPLIAEARSRLETLDRAIAEENARVSNDFSRAYNAALAQEQRIQAQVDALRSSVATEQSDAIQYNIFQREVDTTRELYDGMLQRYKEIGVAGVASNNVVIVDRALVPTKPSSPNLILNLVLSALLGLLLALLLIIAVEQIDQTIKSPSEVRGKVGLPLLGTLPEVSEGDIAEELLDAKSSISEALLSLQTNLSFATKHGIPKSMLFTSTRPNEGKSNSIIGLGHSLARIGHKVLLIDADMRNNSVNNLMQIESGSGLSNYLTGAPYGPEIISKSGYPNFDIVAAGPKPPSAAELLISSRMSELINEAQRDYDVILVDAPPVLGIADAPLIAQAVEGVVYVIEIKGPRVGDIQQSIARLAESRANLLGVLTTKHKSGIDGYGYGYGYDYGYGRADEDESAA